MASAVRQPVSSEASPVATAARRSHCRGVALPVTGNGYE